MHFCINCYFLFLLVYCVHCVLCTLHLWRVKGTAKHLRTVDLCSTSIDRTYIGLEHVDASCFLSPCSLPDL